MARKGKKNKGGGDANDGNTPTKTMGKTYIQVLGLGTDVGDTSPSLLLFTDRVGGGGKRGGKWKRILVAEVFCSLFLLTTSRLYHHSPFKRNQIPAARVSTRPDVT